MNVYLKVKKIFVLVDYDYYYLVKRDGEYMSVVYVFLENFYGVMEDIIFVIKVSDLEEVRKIKLMVVFLNRYFDFFWIKNVMIKMKIDEERVEWFRYLLLFIYVVFEEVD